jgi:divalent anion:Na+ symporter, DASS family
MAGKLNLSLAALAFAGLGAFLATNVLMLDDINLQGGTLVTFVWLAVLLASVERTRLHGLRRSNG